jgi:hypothetical protein
MIESLVGSRQSQSSVVVVSRSGSRWSLVGVINAVAAVPQSLIHKEQRMKRARVGIIAAAVLSVASVAFAQKPDFSGTWTLDPEASGMAAPAGGGGGGRGGRGGGGLGNGATVKQTADSIVIERTMGDNKVTTTYKLDGTESKNTMMGRGGEPTEVVSTAKWDGNKLTVVSKRDMGGQMVETTESWSLTGNVLTIESTGGRGPAKRVYKKTT